MRQFFVIKCVSIKLASIGSIGRSISQFSQNYYINKFCCELVGIKPKLLKDDYWIKNMIYFTREDQKKKEQSVLIYQGIKDGLNNQQYWNKVNGKANLLMVIQSKTHQSLEHIHLLNGNHVSKICRRQYIIIFYIFINS
ncbi:unnamed protein product [Paramecium octaurelia]|uniref:TLDc domain-containing protein n=1 Tax=Paramecium octaurelia TaxID=43137 RepID=A0A8S1VQH7_PAROT|nr:unnamed protein product [Paramecium octaurelia]